MKLAPGGPTAALQYRDRVLRDGGDLDWGLGGVHEGELAAGGHDIAAARIADEVGDVALEEDLAEGVDALGSGFLKRKLTGIPGDQIYLGNV